MPQSTGAALKPDTPDVIGENEWQSAMLSCLIDLGKDLGMETLAEGVETTEQSRVLSQLGCDTQQGYVFGRPMSAAEVLAFIADWPGGLRPSDAANAPADLGAGPGASDPVADGGAQMPKAPSSAPIDDRASPPPEALAA